MESYVGGINTEQTTGETQGKTRKYWTTSEEESLVIAVKEKVVDGWRSGNGWRPGFYKQVAARVRKLVPGSTIRPDPHVVSKLSSWKKDYSNLKILFGASGQGLNPDDYSIPIVGSEAWISSVRVNPEIEKMRGKSYPYYEDWKVMFGNDRATGAAAHDFGSTLDQINTNERTMNPPPPATGPQPSPNGGLTGENDEAMSSTMPPPYVSDSQQNGAKKRKTRASDCEDQVVAMMASYMAETKEAISELSKAIASLNGVDPAVTKVFGELKTVPGFTMVERVAAARRIGSSRSDVAIFFSLDEESKGLFIQSILFGAE